MNFAIWSLLFFPRGEAPADPPPPPARPQEGDLLAEVVARCGKGGVISAAALLGAGFDRRDFAWVREGLERLGWKRANNADAFVAPGVCPTLETSP